MENIKNAIKNGEKAVIEYLEQGLLKDSDISIFKSYLKVIGGSSDLDKKYKESEKKMIVDFITDMNKNIASAPNFILFKSLSKKQIDKEIVFNELISRFKEKKVNIKEMLNIIKKNESIELLRKMPEEIQ